jgi:hypothetical protein
VFSGSRSVNVAKDHAIHDSWPEAFCDPRGQVEEVLELARTFFEKDGGSAKVRFRTDSKSTLHFLV